MVKLIIIIILSVLVLLLLKLGNKKPTEIRLRRKRILDRFHNQD